MGCKVALAVEPKLYSTKERKVVDDLGFPPTDSIRHGKAKLAVLEHRVEKRIN